MDLDFPSQIHLRRYFLILGPMDPGYPNRRMKVKENAMEVFWMTSTEMAVCMEGSQACEYLLNVAPARGSHERNR